MLVKGALGVMSLVHGYHQWSFYSNCLLPTKLINGMDMPVNVIEFTNTGNFCYQFGGEKGIVRTVRKCLVLTLHCLVNIDSLFGWSEFAMANLTY